MKPAPAESLRRQTMALVASGLAAALVMGCSGGGSSASTTTSSSSAGGTGGSGGSSASSSGSGASSASASSGSGTGGGSAATDSLPAGDCYTFATMKSQPYSMACGDLMALTGAMVDLNAGAGSSQLCLLSGTYPSLGAVPSSYASCAWTSYIEGGGGLANQGVIVLDSTGMHHYRMWIASNALPSLAFSFADID